MIPSRRRSEATAYLKSVFSGGGKVGAASAADSLHAVNASACGAGQELAPIGEGIKNDRVALYRLYLLDYLAEMEIHAELL